MTSSLLQLGPFSFDGLESPERIHLKSKQRLAIHHLGSGSTKTDNLGEDYEVATFRGIFSGANASNRIRLIDNLRTQGLPLSLTWGSSSLSVIIQEFELDYSSDLWVPYRLSCCVVCSTCQIAGAQPDLVAAPPFSQIDDLLGLLRFTSVALSSDARASLVSLASSDFDAPPPVALSVAQNLIGTIDSQLPSLDQEPRNDSLEFGKLVTNFGLEATLGLARNRVLSIVVAAESINQP